MGGPSGPHEPWDRDREDDLWWASYYDGHVEIQCGRGFGCDERPKLRRGTVARQQSWMRRENQ